MTKLFGSAVPFLEAAGIAPRDRSQRGDVPLNLRAIHPAAAATAREYGPLSGEPIQTSEQLAQWRAKLNALGPKILTISGEDAC